ncbi:MAG: protein translocase SEC61 complex subunit gamma [Candidatus Pacearchaeota archaeon]
MKFINNFINNTKNFFIKCGRVWKIMKKPTLEEFKIISKVSIIGLLIIGFLGFLINLIIYTLMH